MAKTKEKKNYKVSVEYGRLTLTMLEKNNEGRICSMSVPYPYYEYERNDKGEMVSVKKTRKQVEKMILNHLGYKA